MVRSDHVPCPDSGLLLVASFTKGIWEKCRARTSEASDFSQEAQKRSLLEPSLQGSRRRRKGLQSRLRQALSHLLVSTA